jgi:replicative DNA helicase
LEAEQSVLGGIILDPDSERVRDVMGHLSCQMFYRPEHKLIFKTIKILSEKNQPADLLTLSDNLAEKNQLDSCGGFAYLAELSKNTPSAANIREYARIVRDSALLRETIGKINSIAEMLYSRNGMTVQEKLELSQSLFSQLRDMQLTGQGKGAIGADEVITNWLDEVELRFSGKNDVVKTGLPALDSILSPKGLINGSLFVIGARPKMCKTTFLTQMAIHCAMKEKKPAVIFSLEMQKEQVFERMVGQHSGINTNIFYQGSDNDADFSLAHKAAFELSQSGNIFIDETHAVTIEHIAGEARKIKRDKGMIGAIYVDYLTMMNAPKAERNDLAYGAITKGLKSLAKELDCIVVLVTQLNRGIESRADKRPFPSDSRDTGQIEQECDYWLGLYREYIYNDKANPEDMELTLRLNRHGNTGTAYAKFKNGLIMDCDQQEARDEKERKLQEIYKKRKAEF